MTESQNTSPRRPIMARAAENGLYLSVMMCVLLLLLGGGTVLPLLSWLFLVGAVALPVVAYMILSRNCRRSGADLSFAEIWAEGISSFFLGSLLPAVMTYVLLRFAFPDFVYNQVNTTIEMLGAIDTPEAETLASTFRQLVDKGALPSPADIAANIISFNIVAGTVLSLFLAIALSTRLRMERYRNKKSNF